jgi:polysaccharide deacetylase 2 family uncharacterized protein YibQ
MARRGEHPPIGLSWVITWPLSAVFAVLVFLSAEEIRHPSKKVVMPPATIGGADWRERFPQRLAAVDAALHKAPLQLPSPVVDERGSGPMRWMHRRYDIAVPRDDHAQAEAAIAALQDVDPGLAATADNINDGTDVRVGLDGLLVSTLRFRWEDIVTPKPSKPRVAVLVGPLGDDLRLARKVAEIEGPIALGIGWQSPFARQVAELGKMFDHEVLVQLDCPDQPPVEGANGGEWPNLDLVLQSVPTAAGVAWKSGCMCGAGGPYQTVLEEVGQRALLFVGDCDGGPKRAQTFAHPISLGEGTPDALRTKLSAAVEKTRKEGSALVVIGTPSDVSLATLTQAMPEWRAAEIDVVPISSLTETVALAAR